LFGLSSTLNKIALEKTNPTVIAGSIYFVAGVFLFAIHLSPLCKKIQAKLTSETDSKTTSKDLRVLVPVILCGSIIAPFLLLSGLNQTTATNSSLLLNAESLFTVLIAFVFLNERCSRKEYVGIMLLLIGVIFVTTNGVFQKITLTENLPGNLMIIGACFFWGIDNNLSKFLSRKKDTILITGIKCFIGGTSLLGLSFLLGFSFYSPLVSLPYILFVGAFSIAFSILFFLFALRKLGSMRTSVLFSFSSLFGVVSASVILREGFTLVQWIAGVVMILGIYVLYRCRRIQTSSNSMMKP